MRWTKGQHAFIVATHVDKAHIHNHIIYNSTNLSADGKWQDFKRSGIALQKVSDLVCIEHGLSTIRSRSYGERKKYVNSNYRLSIRSGIRKDVEDIIASNLKTYEEFIDKLIKKGYKVKGKTNLSILGPSQQKYIRLKSLGPGYSEENIRRRIGGIALDGIKKTSERDFDVILNFEEIIAKHKGPGYEKWAKRYNMKQLAKTMCFLQEKGIKDFSELVDLCDGKSKRFDELATFLRKKQSRLDDITKLKKHIIDYARTRAVYEGYRKSGYSKKYYETHREELELRKAAKEFFDEHGYKHLPKVKDLNVEFASIIEEKKKAYAEYREVKESMKDFLIAKQNIEAMMKSEEREEKQKSVEKEK